MSIDFKKERTMKKLLLCIAVVLAFAITSAAQDTNPQSSNTPTSSQASGSKKGTKASSSGSKSLTGCVEKGDNGYVVKNGRYKTGVKVSGSDDLAPHDGHTVKLTGSWTTPGQEFNETKLAMVSDTCKMGGKSSTSSTGKTGKKKGSGSGSAAGSTPPGF
jgi:hypothetical protein